MALFEQFIGNINDKKGEPADKDVVAKVKQKLQDYSNKINEYGKLDQEFSNRFGLSMGQISGPEDIIAARMIAEARDRSSKGKSGGVTVIGDPLNQNTCLAGVCTIASNAGVNFNKMSGNLHSGLATDKDGRKIPQYNPLFTSQLSKSGYYELQPGEKPKPGDLVQYFEPVKNGELKPYHMEFITEDRGDGNYKTFNNYSLFNEGVGEANVRDARGTDSTGKGRASNLNRFYRITPEAAKAAVGEENMPFIESARKAREELAKIRSEGIPGESEKVFLSISSGMRKGKLKWEVLKEVLPISKNDELVKYIVDQLYLSN